MLNRNKDPRVGVERQGVVCCTRAGYLPYSLTAWAVLLQELGMLLPGALAKSPHVFQCWRTGGESRRHLKSWYSKEMRLSHGRAESNTLQSSAALAVHGRTPRP